MRRLLEVSAAIELGAGIALLIWPSQTVNLLVGSSAVLPPVAVVRFAGAALLALGAADGLGSRREKGGLARGLGFVMTLYNFGAAAGLAFAGFKWPPGGILLWPAFVLHAAMGAWCALRLLRERRASRP
jgi:hypothetical protein